MANCPNCGEKIPFWNIKAECSKCGVSIPNFNWVERLEEDNKNAEKSFGVFYKTINRMQYSLLGSKLRIVRLVLTFLPVIGFILPWASVKSDGSSFDLALLSFSGGKTAIDILSQVFSNFSLISANMGFENNSGPVTFMFLGTVFFFLSLLFIVFAFLLNILKCAKPKTKSTVIFDIFSIAASIVSVVLFTMASSGNDFTAFAMGSLAAINISGGFSWGYIVAVILLIAATGINVAVAVAPAKSDEELEAERIAKADAKEAKAKAEEIRKQKAREEAAKVYEEEQKNIISEAKKKVAERKAKEEAKKHTK